VMRFVWTIADMGMTLALLRRTIGQLGYFYDKLRRGLGGPFALLTSSGM